MKEFPTTRWLTVLAALLALAMLAAGCEDDVGDTSASPTPGSSQQVSHGAPLHEARLDLAARLKVALGDVALRSVRSAGFDGCLGVATPGQACTEQLIGGYIATYAAAGQEHRYDFGGSRWVFADPAKQITDGVQVPPEIAPDLNRELAAYAREDLALRVKGGEPARVTAIVPLTWPNGCMGFLEAGMSACDSVLVDGAAVFLLGPDGKTYRYHAGGLGVIATDFLKGQITFEPNAAVRVSQQLLRDDLARRLSASANEIELVAYRLVTWPDGCVGVYRQNAVCSQALTPGFLALLRGPDGNEYRYHGGDQGSFVAASFETGARLGEPLPRQG